ncbi:MAG: 3-isopropylmalate dehydrogenase [Lachnospiraceae bacterium]|nr:3-isopropylmalate dehydrogenase [Lachnospiraceae bacterium]
MLQWHPAFFAGIQIELREEKGKVSFESEHQLGTKPMQIDVLIIKKDSNEPMEKNIGRIFRKHNIVEYKSPKDYLSVDDFYKVYGYACFYKADVEQVDSIRVDEITLTFVCKGYPRKLIQHLTEVRGFGIELFEAGIYYIKGDIFPIQLIVTSKLSKENNFWLKNLTDDLPNRDAVEELAREYHEYQKNTLYRSVMNVIIKANEELFKEESDVCEAIIDLFRDEYDKGVEDAKQLGVQQGIEQGIEQNLCSLVKKGLITVEKAAAELNLSVEEFMDKMKKIEA